MQLTASCQAPTKRASHFTSKLLRVMKLTSIFLLAACLQVSARVNSQQVTLKVTKAPLSKVLEQVTKQTGYEFLYLSEYNAKANPVSIQVNNVELKAALDEIFKNQPFRYEISNKTIVVSPKKTEVPLVTEGLNTRLDLAPPPTIDVTITVISAESNQTLEGASVTVKGNNKGVATDVNGRATIKDVDANATIVISFTGYTAQEVKLNSRNSVVVKLIASTNELQEVVINKGYYTEKQRNTVGNVGTVTAAEIERQPVQNPLLALQGKIPGIEITQLTGLPGGGVTVRIQGQNSLRSNALDPLIVIDGVPYPSQLYNNGREALLQGGSPLNYVNPSDIESITVLKDADATSIYGSRAANGAILITTKKGKIGKPKLSVNLQQGWGKVTRRVDMMNSRQYLDMRYEAYNNDGINLATQTIGANNYDLKLWDTTRNTDWQKELIGGTAQYSTINTSISGGTSIMQYLIGGTYSKQTTVFPGNFDDKSGGLHFNLSSATANEKFKIQLSGSYFYDRNHIPGGDLTRDAVLLEPVAPPLYNDNGTLNWAPNAAGASTWNNPLAYTQSIDFNYTSKSLVSNANMSYNIFHGLDVSSSFGYSSLQNDLYNPTRLESIPPESRPFSTRTAIYGKREMSTWIIEPQIRYSGRIGKGRVEGLAGTTFQQNKNDQWVISGSGYADDQLMRSLRGATSVSAESSSALYKYNAFFGRLNYNWDKKYVVNLTGRRDGSSRFGDKNKFHNFWSAGMGWIFSEEKWIQRNISFLSFGKLRGTYGITGNDQIGDYQYISTYGVRAVQIPYQNSSSLVVNGIPNPNLQWEETKKWQCGIDLGFAHDRIALGVTYAKNVSSNQLVYSNIPRVTGFTTVFENIPATIRNTTWEFTLNTVNLKRKDINWTTSINLTIPHNKLVSFPNLATTSYGSGNNGVIVGQPLGTDKVYRYAGVDPTTGKYLVFDSTGVAVVGQDGALNDFPVNTLSKYYGGLSNSFTYKGFQLDFTFQFVRTLGTRNMYYNNGNGRLPGSFNYRDMPNNEPVSVLNRWQKAGDQTEVAKFTTSPYGFFQWPVSSDAFYSYDASYVRLKNLSLSWQLPKNIVQKAKVQNCLFYFRGENLMTITKYSGLDPETRSIETLPPMQVWTIGAKLEF